MISLRIFCVCVTWIGIIVPIESRIDDFPYRDEEAFGIRELLKRIEHMEYKMENILAENEILRKNQQLQRKEMQQLKMAIKDLENTSSHSEDNIGRSFLIHIFTVTSRVVLFLFSAIYNNKFFNFLMCYIIYTSILFHYALLMCFNIKKSWQKNELGVYNYPGLHLADLIHLYLALIICMCILNMIKHVMVKCNVIGSNNKISRRTSLTSALAPKA